MNPVFHKRHSNNCQCNNFLFLNVIALFIYHSHFCVKIITTESPLLADDRYMETCVSLIPASGTVFPIICRVYFVRWVCTRHKCVPCLPLLWYMKCYIGLLCIEYRLTVKSLKYKTHQISTLERFPYSLTAVFAASLESRCKVENEDVVGAAPTSDSSTTSEWSTMLLPIKVCIILEVLR